MSTTVIDTTPGEQRRRPADAAASDAELLTRVRSGDDDAYAVLFTRHRCAAERLAHQICRDRTTADDVVADAFAAILSALRNGSGPEEAFRPYLLTTVRHRSFRGSRTPEDPVDPTDGGGALDGAVFDDDRDDRRLMADAYRSLPERWQLVLWHAEVEGQRPAEIAPLVGLSPHATAALAHRAREGLREAYLRAHLSHDTPPTCTFTVTHLAALVRGNLRTRDHAKVDGHLATCERCRQLRQELLGVNKALRSVVAPLVLGTAAAGYLARHGRSGGGATTIADIVGRAGGPARRATAVAAGLALVVGFLVLRSDRPRPGPEAAQAGVVAEARTATAPPPAAGDPTAAGGVGAGGAGGAGSAAVDLPGGVVVRRVATTECEDRFGVALAGATPGGTAEGSTTTVLTAVLVRDGSTPLRALGLAVDDAVTTVTGSALGTLRSLTATATAATGTDSGAGTAVSPTGSGACVTAPGHTLLAPTGAWGLLVTYLPPGSANLDDLRAVLLERPFALLGDTVRSAVRLARSTAADVLADLPALGTAPVDPGDQIAALLGPAVGTGVGGGGGTLGGGGGGGTLGDGSTTGGVTGPGGIIGGADPATPPPTVTPPLGLPTLPSLPSLPGLPPLPNITLPPVTLPPLGLP